MYTIPETITLIVLNQMVRHRKVVICVGFNSHHGMWGSLLMDANERTLVSFIDSNDYVVLNTSTPTHFYPVGAGLWNILDLSIVSNSIAGNCSTVIMHDFRKWPLHHQYQPQPCTTYDQHFFAPMESVKSPMA